LCLVPSRSVQVSGVWGGWGLQARGGGIYYYCGNAVVKIQTTMLARRSDFDRTFRELTCD
jgi:hypothetical protein